MARDQHNQLFPGAPPPFCLHITYENGGMNPLRSYLPADMRKIREQLRDPINYDRFQLVRETMARIIAMGIKKQPIGGAYHRSRAGKSLFYRIHNILTHIRKSTNLPRSHTPTLASFPRSNVSSKNLLLSQVNARLVKNKIHQLQYELINKNIDLCAITETWLQNNDMIVDQIPQPGYHIILHPRTDGHRGGGVALIYKDGIKVSDHKYNPDEKFLEANLT